MSSPRQRELAQTLAKLLGKTKYTVEAVPCRGKFRGRKDYALRFEDDSRIFISLGYEQYEMRLSEKVEEYRYFREHYEWLKAQVELVIKRDNLQADTLGLAPIEFVDLRLRAEPTTYYEFWIEVICRQNGKTFSFLETNLNYACLGVNTLSYFTKKKERKDDELGNLMRLTEKKYSHILFGYLREEKDKR